MNFLGSGRDYGTKLSYALQDKDNGGIADALSYVEDFADEGNIAVILGDNVFEDDFSETIKQFSSGARVFLKEVKDPQRFGVPVFDDSGKKIIRIEEKPKEPKSNYAQVGFYIFDNRVFKIIKNLKPSERGELEIVDVANFYLSKGELSFDFVKGFWFDAGTHDSLIETAMWLYKKSKDN
jgi:glucose-1-phosphate thymidylyltransferase